MKSRIVMSLMALILGSSAIYQMTGIEGLVTDVFDKPVLFAKVALYQEGVLVSVTQTDLEGRYYFTGVDAGCYDLEFSYIGLSNQIISRVIVESNKVITVDANLEEESHVICEAEIVGYKVPLIELDNTTSGNTIRFGEKTTPSSRRSKRSKKPKKKRGLIKESISALPTKSISRVAATTAGVSVSASESGISIRGSRNLGSDYFMDGFMYSRTYISDESMIKVLPKATVEPIELSEGIALDIASDIIEPISRKIEIKSGLLTAAEWNDLDDWKDWQDLTQDGVYKSMKNYWGLPIGKRESVFLTNDNNIPLVNVRVQLIDSEDSLLWSTMTDNNGKAELWHPHRSSSDTYIHVNTTDDELVSNEDTTQGLHITSSQSCQEWNGLDIMFVVDATNSMSDEIEYLQAELEDIVNRSSNGNISIRTGSVFYKDKFDDYLTQTSHLTDDINVTLDFIATQAIGGGGDYPEAMDVGLEKALDEEWNKDALSRIIFLLLDAPPHDDAEVLQRLANQVRIAADKGIKIIPITASGIDRETEYLMKQMAMMTNGTYVFLTDDSGIGNPHLEHVLPNYKVEKLNDLITRLIENYSQQLPCNIVNDSPPEEKNGKDADKIKLSIFPNPTSDYVNVKIDGRVDEVALVSGTGRQIEIQKVNNGKDLLFDAKDLVSGMYSLLFYVDNKIVDSKSIIVVK